MIPTLLLAGIIIGLLPRNWFIVGIVISATAWTLLLAVSKSGAPVDATSMVGDFALAAINAAVAVFVTRKIVHLAQALGKDYGNRQKARFPPRVDA